MLLEGSSDVKINWKVPKKETINQYVNTVERIKQSIKKAIKEIRTDAHKQF